MLETSVKFIVKVLTGLVGSLLLSGSVLAQTFPTKPVTLMVPYPAGGVSDVIARTLNVSLAKHLGQPVIVENLGGASGAIAAQKVLNAPADGHIIFQGGPNELILAPLANAAVKYKSEEFRLVQMITINPMAVLARKDLPVNNGDELVAYAKKSAASGAPMTLTIVNNTSARIGQVTEQRISPTERALIIQEAVSATAAQFSDPNSKTSRAMGRNYITQRSR